VKNQFFLLASTLLLAASANAGIQDQNRDHNNRPPPLFDGFSNPFFTDKFSAWEQNANNWIKLHVLVDRSTLEVFVDDGVQVASTTFFMKDGPPTEMELEAENNSVTVQNLTAYSLKSIWR
jgi:sucrose-6-phosphate hydrolase SacC (GH32 family)